MTRNELEQVYYVKREIEMWRRKLENLRNQSLVSSPIPSETHSTRVSDKVGKRAERTIMIEEKIEAKCIELATLYNNALDFIFTVPDSLERQVIYCRCVEHMNWLQVAIQVGGDNTAESVRKIHARFFEKYERRQAHEQK